MATRTEDRLRSFVDLLLESLDGPGGGEIARRAYLSRFHFDRLVSAALRESPAAFRRRLLLERAAFQLAGAGSVTEIAFDAGYGSLEAFTRAFARAFGLAPSRFRDSGRRDFRLPAPNGVHFHPPAGLLVPGRTTRRRPMDLTDRMIEHDLWLTRRLLDGATRLPDSALDEPVPVEPETDNFAEAEPTIRSMLARLVWTKEMWASAIAGRPMPENGGASLAELSERLERSGAEFAELVRGIRDRGSWDDAFVDALCDPPESFTFGGMVAHVLTRSAYRRHVLLAALRERGADVGTGDPIEWERLTTE
jgi:AraC-like DNA-binding protein